MPYAYTEVDLNDVDDDDLIDELEGRGYYMVDLRDEHVDSLMSEAIWRFRNGYIEDAVLLIERRFPSLYGLHKRIK